MLDVKQFGKTIWGPTRHFFLSKDVEEVELALIRRAASMPEEQPLKTLASLQLIFESKNMVSISNIEQIQQFSRRFHHRERWRTVVVDDNRDSAVWI